MVIFSYVFLGIGALCVLVGLFQQATQRDTPKAGEHGVEGTIKATTGLLKVIEKFPSGLRLIIFGLILIGIGMLCWVLGTTGSVFGA